MKCKGQRQKLPVNDQQRFSVLSWYYLPHVEKLLLSFVYMHLLTSPKCQADVCQTSLSQVTCLQEAEIIIITVINSSSEPQGEMLCPNLLQQLVTPPV